MNGRTQGKVEYIDVIGYFWKNGVDFFARLLINYGLHNIQRFQRPSIGQLCIPCSAHSPNTTISND